MPPGNQSGIQPGLTEGWSKAIHFPVKPLYPFQRLALLLFAAGSLRGQDTPPPLAPLPKIPGIADSSPVLSTMAPPDVVASASTAVSNLGAEVVMGHYQVAVQRMNPLWKKRTAKLLGGEEVLEKQLAGVTKQMVQQGISMISFKPVGQPRSYEVGAGKEIKTVNGEKVESLVFNQWMVMIPTVTKFRIVRENEKTLFIESVGFQVAISDKGKNDWTFIDGSGLSVNDLRSLYFNLPQDMELPPVEKREAR